MKALSYYFATVSLLSTISIGCSDKTENDSKGIEQVTLARCQDGICLVYLKALTDSDMDGFSDEDEKALGTDPNDPKSFPRTADIAKEIGNGSFESFNRRINEIIVLPEKTPDGRIIGSTPISGIKKETLKKLGITSSTLAAYGLSFETGFTLASALPEGMKLPEKASDKPPFTTMVGGIDIALYSDEADGGTSPTDGEIMTGGGAYNERAVRDRILEDAKQARLNAADAGTGGFKAWCYEQMVRAVDFVSSPNGGKKYSDPELSISVQITKENFEIAWYKSKGGLVGRPVNPDGGGDPLDGLEPPPQVLGQDPNGPIILVDPEQMKYPWKNSIIVLPSEKPTNKKEQNTNFGPMIIELIGVGSGKQPGPKPPTDGGDEPGGGIEN